MKLNKYKTKTNAPQLSLVIQCNEVKFYRIIKIAPTFPKISLTSSAASSSHLKPTATCCWGPRFLLFTTAVDLGLHKTAPSKQPYGHVDLLSQLNLNHIDSPVHILCFASTSSSRGPWWCICTATSYFKIIFLFSTAIEMKIYDNLVQYLTSFI